MLLSDPESRMTSLRTLLASVIDYAGLFPPAGLDMSSAVRNYHAYFSGKESWALGRFIVPVARLDEFSRAYKEIPTVISDRPWCLSALAGVDLHADRSAILQFNQSHKPAVVIDTVEMKTSTEEEIKGAKAVIPVEIETYFEIPIHSDPNELIDAIGVTRSRAKARTGGITPDAFPTSSDLLRFIHACTKAGVPFKATAGLHHPIRSVQRLTYENNAPTGMMFGFLNVFLTTAFIQAGMEITEAIHILEEQSLEAFIFSNDGVSWRTHRLTIGQLETVRARCAVSFGSCSFREPLDDLHVMNLL